ncbi:MAG: hypothetical protein J2P33_00475 [Actinobacteria bacterium]|nr:hypothetical protein [Actinomycetota bacterium]
MRRAHERQPAGPAPATPPPGGRRPGARLCVLLACFPGAKRAAKVRRALSKQITGPGDLILDEVIVKVNGKHRVQVYDPRRVLAGTLTPALTWGVFGLLSGGVASGGGWAIVGAICGGIYAYYTEHLLTKNELRRLGSRLSGDSSSIVAFVQGGDGKRMLSATGSFQPATASVAEIGADLSAQVAAGAGQPTRSSSAPPGGGPLPTTTSDVLSMLLLRYRGTDTANHELAKTRPAHHKEREAVEPEMVFRAPEHGRLKAGDPKQGVAAMAKSSIISWGVFGLAFGLIAGTAGDHGVLSHIKAGIVTGILWAIFGLVAGALYGLWAGRAVSARRLRGVSPVLPRGTSTVLAWSEQKLTQRAVDDWSEPGSERLILRFNPVADGVLLEV